MSSSSTSARDLDRRPRRLGSGAIADPEKRDQGPCCPGADSTRYGVPPIISSRVASSAVELRLWADDDLAAQAMRPGDEAVSTCAGGTRSR
jgi:hypothetical protein